MKYVFILKKSPLKSGFIPVIYTDRDKGMEGVLSNTE